MLIVLLLQLHAAVLVVRGLAVAVATVTIATLVAFLPWRFVLGPSIGAAVGLAVYGALLVIARPAGLAAAWRYLRALA